MDEREDSPDLTDDEILSAIDSSEPVIPDPKCPKCSAEVRASVELRRRRPYLFSRITQTCFEGHVTVYIFRLTGEKWSGR